MLRREGITTGQEVALTISLAGSLASGNRLYQIGDRGGADCCFSRLVSSLLSVSVIFDLPEQVHASSGSNHGVEAVVR